MDDRNQKNGLPSVSLRQMHYALAAADHGNVTEAARRLNVSQPAVSAAIALLESHYATPLFKRQPGQGVTLTGFGRALFPAIRSLLRQAEGVSVFGEVDGPPQGEVMLGVYDALAPYYLPALLTRLAAELPQLRVKFNEASLDALIDGLAEQRLDLAITYDVGLDRSIAATTLYELQPFVLAAPSHPLASKPKLRLRDLAGADVVLLDQPASANYVLALLHAHGAAPGRIVRTASFELQRSLVAHGHGVAVSHTRPRTDMAYDGKRLKILPLADRLAPQRVLLATPAHGGVSRAAAAASDVIIRHFAATPGRAVGAAS